MLCDEAEERYPVSPLSVKRQHWSGEDPAKAEGSAQEVVDSFRRVRDQTARRVQHPLGSPQAGEDTGDNAGSRDQTGRAPGRKTHQEHCARAAAFVALRGPCSHIGMMGCQLCRAGQ